MRAFIRPLSRRSGCSSRFTRHHCLANGITRVGNEWLKIGFSTQALCRMSEVLPFSRVAGQPTSETHPELLLPAEIMPGITANEIASRRKALMSKLPKDSVAIFNSAVIKQMTDVVPYPFRQSADYLYYTGCQQAGGIAVIQNGGELCMFMPDPDPERTTWEGHTADTTEVVEYLKADRAFNMSQLSEMLSPMLKRAKGIYVDKMPFRGAASKLWAFKEAMQDGKVHNVQGYTDEVRYIKSPAEIKLMRHSAAIACQAFLQAMKVSRSHPHEHILAATIEYECKIKGAQCMAFPPVVGGGVNGTVIHYSRNDQWVRRGDFVLVDAGCEYFGYVSDITRTWSPSGDVSDAQRQLYEIVLSTMKECLPLCKPGYTLGEIHQYSTEMLLKATDEIGITKGRKDYVKINPTHIGHYLGLDVHDCASISKDRKLEPGVVITIEPGLYIPRRCDLPERFQGIGIRIEDDVLITNDGHEVLTASIPKELNELEAWMQY